MNNNKKFLITLICISLIAITILSIPMFIDYYINHDLEGNTKTYDKNLVVQNQNYIIEGKYNESFIDTNGYSIAIDRQLNNSWLYRECNHIKGDEVKYYGVFYQYTSDKGLYNLNDNVIIFALKRELC